MEQQEDKPSTSQRILGKAIFTLQAVSYQTREVRPTLPIFKKSTHKYHIDIGMKLVLTSLAPFISRRKIYRIICKMARDGMSRPISGID